MPRLEKAGFKQEIGYWNYSTEISLVEKEKALVVSTAMARFIHPYKIHPERARAWTMEETKIPHRPNSASRPSRRDFPIPVVVNPAFQQQFNEPTETVDEDGMEPTLMEAPQAQGPRRVTKRENINVIRECEWDVKEIEDKNVGRKTPLNRPLVVLLTVVCLTSSVSLILTLLILSGSAGTRNCSCDGGAGKRLSLVRKKKYEFHLLVYRQFRVSLQRPLSRCLKTSALCVPFFSIIY